MALRALASRSATSGVAVTAAAAGRRASFAAAPATAAVGPFVQQHRRSRCSRSLSVVASVAATRSAVSTDKAPGAVGPYSQAIKTSASAPLLFVSGQVALVPGTKELAAGGVEAQAEQCLKNLAAILEAGGASLGSVVKTTVLLADMGDFAAVNGVYARYFDKDPQPARACFAVKALPLGALVEIEATAVASG